MASSHTDKAEHGNDTSRAPWFRDVTNWLLLIVVFAAALWLARLFLLKNPDPVAAHAASPTSSPQAYREPATPARIVQHAHTAPDAEAANPMDLAGTLARAPKEGDFLLAFGSNGFGCVAAPGWTIIGGAGSGSVAVAYRIARSGDAKALVPFTTPRATGYTLELIEIAGGPDIVASPQAGGNFVPDSTIRTSIALRIPQAGGILFRLYAASGKASGSGAPIHATTTLPAGQAQTLVDRVAPYDWGGELVVRATTTDPSRAAQPFAATEATTFAGHRAPGNVVTGWFVWVGGILPDGTSKSGASSAPRVGP